MDICIPFNKPHQTGREADYLREVAQSGRLSGNGPFTKRCQAFFEKRYGFRKCLLTTSCTDALEMAALLTGVGPGDEVIVPSYTFVSTALAFVRTGATVVFADSCRGNPNVDPEDIARCITPRTKVIVPVHYAGVACDMAAILALAEKHNLLVVEDAAQAIDSFYESKPLGSIGHLAAFSFHETKNIVCGEGGLLVVNDERFVRRAEILWEKGTNRAEFFRGEVNKYGWVDVGSSFLPSELNAAYLWAQLESLDEIQAKRKTIWETYNRFFTALETPFPLGLPDVPAYASNNAHNYYLVFPDLAKRTAFVAGMKEQGIACPFHYLPLHSSDCYRRLTASRPELAARALPNCDRFADGLVRLPLFADLDQASEVCEAAAKSINLI